MKYPTIGDKVYTKYFPTTVGTYAGDWQCGRFFYAIIDTKDGSETILPELIEHYRWYNRLNIIKRIKDHREAQETLRWYDGIQMLLGD